MGKGENLVGKLEEIYELRSKSGCTSTMLHIFKEYAEKCDHITEFGFGGGHGASGFLMGKPKKYVAYDLHLQGVWKEYQEFLKPWRRLEPPKRYKYYVPPGH